MARPSAPSFAQLVDWIENRLSPADAAAVAQAIAHADAQTQADVAWLRRFVATSNATMLAPPPSSVRKQLMRRFLANHQDQPSLLQRLVATLTFDSSRAGATAGVRSAPTGNDQRQLVYATDVADIALYVQPHTPAASVDIDGQVFIAGDDGDLSLSVQLLQDGSERSLTTTDELGEFRLEDVPWGVYELIISSDQFEVVIGSVELHA